MKVILTEDVRKLGRKGEIVEVADGYGRNYLMAKGLAAPATGENVGRAEAAARADAQRAAREKQESEKASSRLDGANISYPVKVGEKGKLYGSVSTKDIADAVKASMGLDIDRHKFEIREPIKSLGIYEVTARLYPGVSAVFKVEVKAAE